jgi:hypothetical protein
LLSGTRVPARSIVSAGSVVNTPLTEELTFYSGNPAEAVRSLPDTLGFFHRGDPPLARGKSREDRAESVADLVERAAEEGEKSAEGGARAAERGVGDGAIGGAADGRPSTGVSTGPSAVGLRK